MSEIIVAKLLLLNAYFRNVCIDFFKFSVQKLGHLHVTVSMLEK